MAALLLVASVGCQVAAPRQKIENAVHAPEDEIEKALSPIQSGQFLQIENQLAIFVDMTIASEIPLVGEKDR